MLSKPSGFVLVSEQELTSCITGLHRLCVEGAEPNSPLIALLSPVIGVLFQIFTEVWAGVSFLRKFVTDLVQIFIASLDEVRCFPNTCSPRADCLSSN